MSGSDLSRSLSGFAQALRAAGVPANTARVLASSDAVTALRTCRVDTLYWATRLSFCADRAHIPVFDEVFAAWFGVRPPDAEPVTAEVAAASPQPPDPAGRAPVEDPAMTMAMAVAAAGTSESLRRRNIRQLSAAERSEVNGHIALLKLLLTDRWSRRRRPGSRERFDVHATVRSMHRRGGEPVRPLHRRRVVQPRRLLLLVDVSGSMEDYCDAFLRFGHAAVQARPGTAEVFTLGTRFARATAALAQPDPDLAMRALSGVRSGRGSGTTLGPALLSFLRRWAGHRAVRAATIVVASDGWESGDVRTLEQQVTRLKLLSHRLAWVNPQAGADGFVVMAPGLRRILPLVDAHLAGHSLAALQALAGWMATP